VHLQNRYSPYDRRQSVQREVQRLNNWRLSRARRAPISAGDFFFMFRGQPLVPPAERAADRAAELRRRSRWPPGPPICRYGTRRREKHYKEVRPPLTNRVGGDGEVGGAVSVPRRGGAHAAVVSTPTAGGRINRSGFACLGLKVPK